MSYVTTEHFQRFLKTFDGVLAEFETLGEKYNTVNERVDTALSLLKEQTDLSMETYEELDNKLSQLAEANNLMADTITLLSEKVAEMESHDK